MPDDMREVLTLPVPYRPSHDVWASPTVFGEPPKGSISITSDGVVSVSKEMTDEDLAITLISITGITYRKLQQLPRRANE